MWARMGWFRIARPSGASSTYRRKAASTPGRWAATTAARAGSAATMRTRKSSRFSKRSRLR
jgi:hypothetical protein